MLQEANLHWRYLDTESGLIAPWYTLPALKWLKEQNTKHWNVWEYGSGYSTTWWRLNCWKVLSVDSSEAWAKAMGACHVSDKHFVESIDSIMERWDCIVVDGILREKCVAFCIKHLKPGGYLIIDNYDSEDYDPKVTEELLKHWPRTIHKQPNHSTWQTAIFQKPA